MVFLQAIPDPASYLQWGAMGVLAMVLGVVFFHLLPGHRADVREIVKDNREGMEKLADTQTVATQRIADEYKHSTQRICDEIKGCRESKIYQLKGQTS